KPCSYAYQDWGKDPYGGGVNFGQLHADSDRASKRMINPITDLNIYVCGEAYSRDYQGWVEGALETAEKVVERVHSRLTDERLRPAAKVQPASEARSRT
ncbi:MAG: FAD-dependent oxidoreductase, partial [Acetobacteraceae bacterium]|nr:FAD-dependent oxidoreductase [Acetobacteraceae bacterium]